MTPTQRVGEGQRLPREVLDGDGELAGRGHKPEFSGACRENRNARLASGQSEGGGDVIGLDNDLGAV